MLIIGIIGQPSSGKDTVAQHIETKGFTNVSSGDQIRADMRKLGLPTDRTTMSKFVSEQRKEKGDEYPLIEVARSIKNDTVISGMRNTAEVNFLKSKFGSNFVFNCCRSSVRS